MRVQLAPEKKDRGASPCDCWASVATGGQVAARGALQFASNLNCLEWLAPGGFRHPRSGWDLANGSGAAEDWRRGFALRTVESR